MAGVDSITFPDMEGKTLQGFLDGIKPGMEPEDLFVKQQELADFQLMVTMTTNFIKVFADCNMAIARNMS